MIEIVTLFLGLYSGSQMVSLRVENPVVSVELRLDGETVAEKSQPPWSVPIDLGTELAPRRLEAVGFDRSGAEIGRSQRWIHRGALPDVSDTNERLTALVVTLDGRRQLPPPSQMQGWFLDADGEPLEVVRAERGPALVIVVRDAAAQTDLDHIAHLHAIAMDGNPKWQRSENRFLRLKDEVTFRFLSPRAPPVSRLRRSQEIFTATESAAVGENGFLWHTASVRPLRFQQRISDAVAIAGLEAHASRGRRMVFLLTDRTTESASRYRQQEVRRLLADLQVPLTVWAFDSGSTGENAPSAPGSWTPSLRIRVPEDSRATVIDAFLSHLDHAFRQDLGRALARQRVVWLRGDHLPQTVRLADEAAGIRIAGKSEDAWSSF